MENFREERRTILESVTMTAQMYSAADHLRGSPEPPSSPPISSGDRDGKREKNSRVMGRDTANSVVDHLRGPPESPRPPSNPLSTPLRGLSDGYRRAAGGRQAIALDLPLQGAYSTDYEQAHNATQ